MLVQQLLNNSINKTIYNSNRLIMITNGRFVMNKNTSILCIFASDNCFCLLNYFPQVVHLPAVLYHMTATNAGG